MGGHSHWKTIKGKKMAQDARKGRIFTKLIREITVSARIGGGDPEGNPRLRLAIDKAREQNMPTDNIKRAIQKGTGELPGVAFEESLCEGYGPGGVALLIEMLTDNRNRSIADIRRILTKNGGNMGQAGCVSWMFAKKGQILVEKEGVEEDSLMSVALEAGAEDIRGTDQFEIITAPEDCEKVKKALQGKGMQPSSAQVTMIPSTYVRLEGKEAEQMLRLMEALEEHDDVQNVYANFDIPDEVMEKVHAGSGD